MNKVDKYSAFVFEYDYHMFSPHWLCNLLRAIGEDKNKALLNMKHDEYVVRKYCKMLLKGTLEAEMERLGVDDYHMRGFLREL